MFKLLTFTTECTENTEVTEDFYSVPFVFSAVRFNYELGLFVNDSVSRIISDFIVLYFLANFFNDFLNLSVTLNFI